MSFRTGAVVKEPEVEVTETKPNGMQWLADGNVTFTVQEEDGEETISLTFAFSECPNESAALRQGAAQLEVVARLLLRHAQALARQ